MLGPYEYYCVTAVKQHHSRTYLVAMVTLSNIKRYCIFVFPNASVPLIYPGRSHKISSIYLDHICIYAKVFFTPLMHYMAIKQPRRFIGATNYDSLLRKQ